MQQVIFQTSLYLPISTVGAGDLDEIMAHEVWHLIEKKYGFLKADDFIAEGTATYVENRFAGRTSERHPYFWKLSAGNKNIVQYLQVASIIASLYGEQGDLKFLLEQSERDKIILHSEKVVLKPLQEAIREQVEQLYQVLHRQARRDGHIVLYEGAFKQAVKRGEPTTELPFPFVVCVPKSGGFNGRIYDAGGAANFEGVISAEHVEFVKRYSNRGVNSNPIQYHGRSLQKGIYAGEWIFNSSSATSETSGKFIMTTVVGRKEK